MADRRRGRQPTPEDYAGANKNLIAGCALFAQRMHTDFNGALKARQEIRMGLSYPTTSYRLSIPEDLVNLVNRVYGVGVNITNIQVGWSYSLMDPVEGAPWRSYTCSTEIGVSRGKDASELEHLSTGIVDGTRDIIMDNKLRITSQQDRADYSLGFNLIRDVYPSRGEVIPRHTDTKLVHPRVILAIGEILTQAVSGEPVRNVSLKTLLGRPSRRLALQAAASYAARHLSIDVPIRQPIKSIGNFDRQPVQLLPNEQF